MTLKEPKNFEERLKMAEEKDRLSSPQNKYTKAIKNSTNPSHNRLLGVTSELLGGLFVGLGLGFFLDYLLDTKPIFLAIMTPFGAFIGLYNVYRHVLKFSSAPPSQIDSEKGKTHEKKIDEI